MGQDCSLGYRIKQDCPSGDSWAAPSLERVKLQPTGTCPSTTPLTALVAIAAGVSVIPTLLPPPPFAACPYPRGRA